MLQDSQVEEKIEVKIGSFWWPKMIEVVEGVKKVNDVCAALWKLGPSAMHMQNLLEECFTRIWR